MSAPSVSVIMPVRNGAPFVANAIDSITAQSLRDLELIIVDDGSTDATWDILKQAMKQDSRIRCFRQTALGLTASLNRAIRHSRAPLIARQDADDISLRSRLEKQSTILNRRGLDLIVTRAYLHSTSRITPRLSYYLPKRFSVFFLNPFIHGTFMFTRDLISNIGGYDESFTYSQDYKLIYDAYTAKARIGYLKKPLYVLGRSPNSISVTHHDEQEHLSRAVRALFWRSLIKSR